MAEVRTDRKHYANIAAAIRVKLGETTLYTPAQMAAAIGRIEAAEPSSASLPSTVSQTVMTNDRYYADIAAAIRAQNGETTRYKPSEMAAAILAIANMTDIRHSVTVNLADVLAGACDVTYLSGGSDMEHNGLLSLRMKTTVTRKLMDVLPGATMGGTAFDLSPYITYDYSIDSKCKSLTIENLPVTGDLVINVTGEETTYYLVTASVENGTCSGGNFRHQGGSVKLTFVPNDGYGISNFDNSDSGLNNPWITAIDPNTGNEYNLVDTFIGLVKILQSNDGKIDIQYDSIRKDVEFHVAFEELGAMPANYSVSNSLTNVTTSNTATTIREGSSYTATLSAKTGYVMESVRVTMGGTDITSSAYNASTGAISIASVSGNIAITASAAEIQTPATNSYTVTKESGASYGFSLGSDGWYINDNKDIHSSASMARINLSMAAAGKVTLQCINYGEPSWDFGYVSYLDKTLSTDWNLSYGYVDSGARKTFNANADTSTAIVSLEYDVPAGEHFIVVKYKKDGSGSANGDYFKFKVIM